MKRAFRYNLTRFWFPAIAILLLLYFTYHLIQGDHGYLSWSSLDTDLQESESILQEKKIKQDELEHRVGLLKSENLDPDLLDERVRKMLNHAEKGEVIVFYDPA